MNKKIIIILSIVAFAVLVAGAGTAAFLRGRNTKAPEITEAATVTDATASDSDYGETAGREKTAFPSSPTAVIFDETGEGSSEKIAKLPSYGFNSVIFDYTPDKQEETAAALTEARTAGIYSGIRVDSADIASFIDFFNANNPDFVILSGLDESKEEFVTSAETEISELKAIDAAVSVGVEPKEVKSVAEVFKSTSDLKTLDFIFVNQKDTKLSDFTSAFSAWCDCPFDIRICHSLDKLSSLTQETSQNLIDSVSSVAENTQCRMLAFTPYSEIVSAKSTYADTVRSYILKRENYLQDKEFSISNYNSNNITVEQSTVVFKGTSSPLSELKCNGKALTVAKNGDFSVDCKLNPGSNTVKFEHKGKTYTYNVTYKVRIIKSISPSNKVSIPGEMDVEFTATALSGSTVILKLNGSSYNMKVASDDSDDDSMDSASEFVTYRATVTTPAGKSVSQDLGKYTVSANYKGLSESKTGARVVVTANEVVTEPETTAPTQPETETTTAVTTVRETTTRYSQRTATTLPSPSDETGQDIANTSAQAQSEAMTSTQAPTETQEQPQKKNSMQKYSYTSDYGLGSAKIVEITGDYIEVYPGKSNTSTLSVPDCTPLLKGTVDYYSKSATLDDDTYYYLASGYKVPTSREDNLAGGKTTVSQLKLVNGYKMPSNNIEILSSSTNNGRTVIRLAMNRKVVFNAKLTGQSYSDNGSGRIVKVTGVNCTGIQFTFYDTTRIGGNLNFSNSLIANGKTSVSGDTATMSLNFLEAGKFYGYHAEYASDGCLEITIKRKPSSLSGCTVMLDPGHGGRDGGAACVVSSGSWNEASINLSIATKAKEYLEAEGATVIMTRTSNTFLSLADRNALVRSRHPDLFVSIHCDASGTSSSAYGTTAYYYRAYSQPLAKCVHEALVSAYNNQIYAGLGRTKSDKGTLFGAYRVARVEECPSILVEYGFVTNTAECQALENSTSRDALAKATATGIKNYISRY